MSNKPYSPACDENADPILQILKPRLRDAETLLEIGSGTGQHAVIFGKALPHITWLTSDVANHHAGIRAWVQEAGLSNVLPPVALDVVSDPWPDNHFDAVFSANTTHIMDISAVEAMFAGIGRILREQGLFLLYGPFNRDGQYTSTSNARFDLWLKDRDPASGIRDLEWLKEIAATAGLRFEEEIAMPVCNLMLVWRRNLPV